MKFTLCGSRVYKFISTHTFLDICESSNLSICEDLEWKSVNLETDKGILSFLISIYLVVNSKC